MLEYQIAVACNMKKKDWAEPDEWRPERGM
jgi:hypothetical protein